MHYDIIMHACANYVRMNRMNLAVAYFWYAVCSLFVRLSRY